MSCFDWQLEQHTARGCLGHLHAVLDLAEPSHGLCHVRVGSRDVPGAALLGVGLPSAATAIDCTIRAGDLAASYRPASLPIQVDALWRAIVTDGDDAVMAVVELVVSVRTEQLESQPELTVRSILPCDEVLHLAAAPDVSFTTAGVGDWPLAIEPDDGVSCLLYRLPGSELSYAEMVHPADFRQDRVERSLEEPLSFVKVTHRLFPEPLEKGVILRARVRGALLPRKDDVRLAAASFALFAAAEPPLGA
jgi:hypothetical protein